MWVHYVLTDFIVLYVFADHQKHFRAKCTQRKTQDILNLARLYIYTKMYAALLNMKNTNVTLAEETRKSEEDVDLEKETVAILAELNNSLDTNIVLGSQKEVKRGSMVTPAKLEDGVRLVRWRKEWGELATPGWRVTEAPEDSGLLQQGRGLSCKVMRSATAGVEDTSDWHYRVMHRIMERRLANRALAGWLAGWR